MGQTAQAAKALFGNHRLYLGWGLASAAILVAASFGDPYIFGFSAFCAAAVSGLVALGAAILNWRYLPWAFLAAIPTAVAFFRLSTYDWA